MLECLCLTCLVSSLLCSPISQNCKKLLHKIKKLFFPHFMTKTIKIVVKENFVRGKHYHLEQIFLWNNFTSS